MFLRFLTLNILELDQKADIQDNIVYPKIRLKGMLQKLRKKNAPSSKAVLTYFDPVT